MADVVAGLRASPRSSLAHSQLPLSGGHLKAWHLRDGTNNVFNNGPMDAGPVNDNLWHHAALARFFRLLTD